MLSVSEAINALRTALCKKCVESHIHDAFNHLASCLVLLNSSSPSVQMIKKLRTVLRKPFLPLYTACLKQALQLSSSVLSTVLGKLCDAHSAEDEKLRAAWDETAEDILSGVLDFLDQKDGSDFNSGADGAVWEVLYHILCEFFFRDSARQPPVFSMSLCLSAYNTLAEAAARQIAVQNALRHSAVLGGERLGSAISKTRDFLLLEALLMLFARLLPPIYNATQGKLRRAKFVKEVLGSSKLFECSTELLDIMQITSVTHWDDVAARIIDALARSDITYPQPFSIDEIDVSGRVFPQPLATDSLIMDRQAFLANIVAEDDHECESLQVPYSHIRTITLDNSEHIVPKGKVLIMVYLISPPLVASIEMKPPSGSQLYAKFLLQNDAVGRFMEALRRRGVGKLSFLNPLTGVQRKRKSVSIGSGLKFTDDSSPIPPIASFEGKVQHVNQVYKTDVEDSTISEAVLEPHVGDANSSPTPDPGHAFRLAFKDRDGDLVLEVLEPGVAEEVPATLKSARSIPHVSETSKRVQNSTLPFSLGSSTRAKHLFGDDDELSEISEFEPENNTAVERTETGVSASYNNKWKPTQHKIDPIQTDGSFGATSTMGIESSSSVSKTGSCAEEVTQNLPETGKSFFTWDSPIFGSSSSTQINVSQEPSVPPKVAGSRRKRERIKSSSKTTAIEVDDESSPPHKKSRDDKPGAKEDRVESDETSRGKRYTKTTKGSSFSTELMTVDLDGLPEFKTTCQGTRRSSRIKKRQTAVTGRTRANKMRNKIQKLKVKPTDGLPTCSIERKKLATTPLQDTSTEISHGAPILGSQPVPTLIGESPFSEIDSHVHVPLVEMKSAENITPETCLHREMEMLKAGNIHSCELSQPAKESRGGLDVVRRTSSDVMQIAEEQICVKTEETIDDLHLVPDSRTVDDISQAQEVIKCSVSLEMGEESAELSQPTTGPIPLAKAIATIDNSPNRESSEHQGADIAPVRLETDIHTKVKASDQPDRTVMQEPVCFSPPQSQYGRRNVTFASPIEYILDKKVDSRTQGDSSSRRSLSPYENNTLSPLRIVPESVSKRFDSRDRIALQTTLRDSMSSQAHIKASVHNQATEEVEIQDIVDVLNEIQAVIIKGISDKFRNIKKDVQRGRDELIHQVLDELRSMVVENAKYFNGLVHLEEDYYKNGKAIIRCWEELINCNDSIVVQFQNALKEHDQSISKTFPKSLLHLQPAFPSRCVNNHE